MQVAGKTIAVTGGGNGIGRELVLALLDRGAKVAAIDLSQEGLSATVARAGARKSLLSAHAVDITDRAAVEALPATIVATHGSVDGVINCAGIIQPFVTVDKLDISAIERVMNVNFWGTTYMVKAFLPYLLERPAAHIVNVSSMGGFLPVPGQSAYGASKAAVKLLTEALHSELTGTSVRVTVVFPGAIGTEITKNSGVAAPGGVEVEEAAKKYKTTSPEDAARLILDGMERDAYRVLVGGDAKMMDRLARLAPERAAKLIYSKMKNLLAV